MLPGRTHGWEILGDAQMGTGTSAAGGHSQRAAAWLELTFPFLPISDQARGELSHGSPGFLGGSSALEGTGNHRTEGPGDPETPTTRLTSFSLLESSWKELRGSEPLLFRACFS